MKIHWRKRAALGLVLVSGLIAITEVDALTGLINLVFLDVSENSISDITPLVDNPGIDGGDTLFIGRNDLVCDDPVYMANLETLQERAVGYSTSCE